MNPTDFGHPSWALYVAASYILSFIALAGYGWFAAKSRKDALHSLTEEGFLAENADKYIESGPEARVSQAGAPAAEPKTNKS